MDRICRKCNETKDLEKDFAFRSKAKNTRHSLCRSCQSTASKKHYINNKNSYIKRVYKQNQKIRRRNRDFVIIFLQQHSCVDCGETDIVVLEFDHLHDKVKNISVMIQRESSIESLKTEIAKCDVVCANCHKRRTAKRQNWHKLNAPVV